MTTTIRRRLSAVAIAGTLALTLAACSDDAAPAGGESPSAAETTAEQSADAAAHNDADVEFAQMMIVHHQGAIEMAELAVQKASNEQVRALGERISAAQGPEIELMTGWLEQWGEPTTPEAMDHGGMDHGGMDMEGMSQEEVMAELSALSGVDFDRRFLELMTDHHRGAIEMAETQRAEGENPEAVDLAGTIIDDQTMEITEMENLLRELG
ncbi:DUF305 domain-containing protein [Cellulomonas sp. 179-A 9B4 NHS]|uniref:DUF305 domain-containing protein n=1 Tax=Cellulomonas sp. 179-A 9B4 NHS TaxID=3142379 RepID=UPI0039A101CA